MGKIFDSLERDGTGVKRVSTPKEIMCLLSEWKGMGENLVEFLQEKMLEIESRERSLETVKESVVAVGMEVESLKDSLETQMNTFHERDREFFLFEERKMREMERKEEEFGLMREKFLEDMRLREEKVNGEVKLVHSYLERLNLMQTAVENMRLNVGDRLKEVECREQILGEDRESVAKREREVDFVEGSVAKRLKVVEEREKEFEVAKKRIDDLEKRGKEFLCFQEKETRNLRSREEFLSLKRKEFIQELKIREEKISEEEKLVHGLLERLELAYSNVVDLKAAVSHRCEEIRLKEKEFNLMEEWVDGKIDDLDSKAAEIWEQEICIKEKNDFVVSRENELEMKKKELDLKEKKLDFREKELGLKEIELASALETSEQRAVELDWKEKNLNSVKEFTRTCFKEHLAIKKQLRSERKLVENLARDLEHEKEQLRHRESELESKEKQVGENLKELKLKQQELIYACVKVESSESAALHLTVKMDGRTLQMFLNDHRKDLDLMEEEVLKVLGLSSNPAKLVLDAMEGFYPPHLRKEDAESTVRRTCILLLEQLTKLFLEIPPWVRDEALELACKWRSEIASACENAVEILGFLHLVAAFRLEDCFDSNEILSFVKFVAHHKQMT